MKKIGLLLLSCFIYSTSYGQLSTNSLTDYQVYEKLAAQKKLAFKPNPNTYNYDVTYHRLELDINPNEYFISGTVTTHFIAKENLNKIVFDFSHQLQVSEVLQNGKLLDFSQNNDELNIQLDHVVNKDEVGIIQIKYQGMPPHEHEAFVQSRHSGTPIIWTLSEPFGAKDWWPCKQSLNDKI